MAVKHESEVKIQIGLDENKVPEEIRWTAKEGGVEDAATKALILSVWDHETKETLRMDLWTKDMSIDDMKRFFHQTLMSMADTLQRSTNEEKMAAAMNDFCDYFAEKLELL